MMKPDVSAASPQGKRSLKRLLPKNRLVLWDVVEEHLDEASFLSEQWERALVSPDVILDGVADGPEERLLAHLDGLAIAGAKAGPRLLEPRFESEQPEEVFAAALALSECRATHWSGCPRSSRSRTRHAARPCSARWSCPGDPI